MYHSHFPSSYWNYGNFSDYPESGNAGTANNSYGFTISDFELPLSIVEPHPTGESGLVGLVCNRTNLANCGRLGNDGTPIYAYPGKSPGGTVQGPSSFYDWFHSTNQTVPVPYTFNLTQASGRNFQYSSSSFFPIDGQGWGDQGKASDGNYHNFAFCVLAHSLFGYQGGEIFDYLAEDDLFVYINQYLVLDLGGVHGPISASISLDELGFLQKGNTYAFDLFYCNRHTPDSVLTITTSVMFQCPDALFDWCGVCGGDGTSCCTPNVVASCNDNNACTKDTCGPSGPCIHPNITCGAPDHCHTVSCDPVNGCQYSPIECHEDLCTSTSCDPEQGCVYTPHVCESYSACYNSTGCNVSSGCIYEEISCGISDNCTIYSCNDTTGCFSTYICEAPAKVPAPSIPSFNRSSISISWGTPSFDGGYPIDNYTLSYFPSLNVSAMSNITVPNSIHTYTINSLAADTNYSLAVYANNRLGSSAFDFIQVSTPSTNCGDGVCDPNETCQKCVFDCPCPPSIAPCPGTPACSAHGACVASVCNCDLGWSGPDCYTNTHARTQMNVEQSRTTIKLTQDGGEKSVENNAALDVTFSVVYDYIQEIDPDNNIVNFYNLSTATFLQNSTFLDKMTVYSFYAEFFQNSTANITIFEFTNDTSVEFANQVINVTAGSFKYFMQITQWPFRSIKNKLQVGIFSGTHLESDADCTTPTIDTNIDISNSLRSIQITLNGASLYGRFLDAAILDGVNHRIQYTYDTVSLYIIATIPHFWFSAEFDPDFQDLFVGYDGDNICGRKNHIDKKLIGGIVGGVLGAALVVGLLIFFFVKRQEHAVSQFFKSTLSGAESYDDVRVRTRRRIIKDSDVQMNIVR